MQDCSSCLGQYVGSGGGFFGGGGSGDWHAGLTISSFWNNFFSDLLLSEVSSMPIANQSRLENVESILDLGANSSLLLG